MPSRPQTGMLDQPRLRPTISPSDTYIRPTGDSNLRDLANALGDLAPALQRFAEQGIEKDEKRARTDATTIYEDIKATGKKIKAGEIAPHESKWYRRAAQEQVGRLMASAYGQDLQLAAKADETLSESTDPNDFDQFEAKARSKWLEDHIDGKDASDFMAGFNATSAQGILNARQSFIAEAASRLDGQVIDNTYTEHQLSVKEGLQAGATPEQIAQRIAQRNSALYVANPKLGKALNRTTIEAVFDAARAYEDPSLLTILDHLPGGPKGSTLGLTRPALSKRDEVEREIRMNRQNRLAAEEKDEKRKRAEVIDDVYEKAMSLLEQDPNADVSALATELMGVDRAEAPKLFRLANAFKSAANVDDQGVVHGLYESLFEGELTNDRVSAAFNAGQLTTKTAKDLFVQLRASRGRGSRSLKALIQDPVFKAYEDDLGRLFIRHMGEVPGARGTYAQQQLRREWVALMQSKEGAGMSEALKVDWLQQATTRNFNRFTAGEGASELRELNKESPKPDQPGGGPTLPKWETEPVSPTLDLTAFEKEWKDIQRGTPGRSRFSPPFEALIQSLGLKGADIDRFIQAQRTARSLKR